MIGDCIEKLQTLGSSGQIADFLIREQIRGTPGQSFNCAVAQYLKRETGLEKPSVSTGWAHRHGHPGTIVPIEDYSPLQRFIQDFDLGLYPELVE